MTTASHVLVARLDAVGDVLLAGPAVRAVSTGAGRVTFLASRRGRAAAELLPGVDDVICIPAPWIDAEPAPVERAEMLAAIDRLAGLRLDEAVILTSFHQSPLPLALLLRMAGVGRIAAVSEDYPGSLLDIRHHVPDDIHEVERSLSTVGTLGYRLAPDDAGRLAIRRPSPPRSPLPFTGPYVVVHPGASVPARAWSPARLTALVDRLTTAGRSVVVTGGPAERQLTARVAGPVRSGVVDLGGRVDLGGLADVLAGADSLVSGNTGPAHLAAAVGTPVVSLYAPTVPAVRWRPWGVPHVLLGQQDIPCAGCRARVCPIEGHPCLSSVTVDDVMTALDRLGGARPSPVLSEVPA